MRKDEGREDSRLRRLKEELTIEDRERASWSSMCSETAGSRSEDESDDPIPLFPVRYVKTLFDLNGCVGGGD